MPRYAVPPRKPAPRQAARKPVAPGGTMAWILGILVAVISTVIALHFPFVHPGTTDPAIVPSYTISNYPPAIDEPVPPAPSGWPSPPSYGAP